MGGVFVGDVNVDEDEQGLASIKSGVNAFPSLR